MENERITASEAARRLGLSRERVSRLCRQGRIRGARKIGHTWMIPVGAEIAPPPPRPRPKKPKRRIPTARAKAP